MREAKIFIPSWDNDGRNVSDSLGDAIKYAYELWGGCQTYAANGYWVDTDTKETHADTGHMLIVAMDDHQANVALWRRFAYKIQRWTRQKSVYVVWPSGNAAIISDDMETPTIEDK